jgi:HlyD family secretion protein
MARRGLLLAALVLGGGIGWYVLGPRGETAPPIGIVRATEIRLAPEVSGRLAAIVVKPGDAVRAGDAVARLDNPELAAAVVEAHTAAAEVRAERDRVYAGPRREQVEILGREVEKADSNLTLARQHFDRISALESRQNASREDLDKAIAAVGVAQSAVAGARSRYIEAKAGPIAEDRAIADAKVTAADAAAAILERRLAKTVLTAPVDGIVRVIVGELGEAAVPGRPILTIEAARDTWFSATIREDRLAGLTIGTELELATSKAGRIPVRVTEVRGLGEFATWRAARAVGDHDLNSFQLRLDPIKEPQDLVPGMTVWLTGPQNRR